MAKFVRNLESYWVEGVEYYSIYDIHSLLSEHAIYCSINEMDENAWGSRYHMFDIITPPVCNGNIQFVTIKEHVLLNAEEFRAFLLFLERLRDAFNMEDD